MLLGAWSMGSDINSQSSLQSVSFEQWMSSGQPLVDVRSQEKSANRPIIPGNNGDSSRIVVNLPLHTLLSGERSCELPPRSVPFALLIPNNEDDVEYEQIKSFFFSTRSKSTNKSRCAWDIPQVLTESKELWNDIDKYEKTNSEILQKTPSFRPHARIWQPSFLVKNQILPQLKKLLFLHPQEKIIVYDLGCGAGRDVCYLAEEMYWYFLSSSSVGKENEKRDFPITFIGVDNHKGSAKRCLPFWERRGISFCTQAKLMDLKKTHNWNEILMPSKDGTAIYFYYAVRYLNRSLFQYIANFHTQKESDNVEPEEHQQSQKQEGSTNSQLYSSDSNRQCFIAIHHFCKESKDSIWDFEHPKESHVLERDELHNSYTANWEILGDDIFYDDGDFSRSMIHFVARRSLY